MESENKVQYDETKGNGKLCSGCGMEINDTAFICQKCGNLYCKECQYIAVNEFHFCLTCNE